MIDIEKLIDREIMKEDDQYKKDIYRTHWRTSNFGRCYRMQFWYRQGIGVSNPIEMRALRIFRVGNMFHRDIQNLLPKDRVEVEFTDDNYEVHGHCDHVGDGYCEDFKTIGDWQWKLMNKKGFDVAKDKEAYIYQLMAYCLFFDMPLGRLTFIHKDSYSIRTFDFRLEDWQSDITTELENLRQYWKKGELPPAEPRAYGKKDCMYCPFQGSCDKFEGNTAKQRYELATNPKTAKGVF